MKLQSFTDFIAWFWLLCETHGAEITIDIVRNAENRLLIYTIQIGNNNAAGTIDLGSDNLDANLCEDQKSIKQSLYI